MNYYLEDSDIYLFTTEGMKTNDTDANPEICLLVEEIHDRLYWRSAIVNGRAARLTLEEDIDRAMHSIEDRNPTLSPAIAPRLMLGDFQKRSPSTASTPVK
ncbi:pyridoxamine 5'-phosphate oxidase family protein [Microcoleus sp. F4-D5]|uniref:pyridoxamine 5'-phosphate oxidase family protein n=1 Tax=Microcoleus sp. F4-D5 TaxID=2818760 RepID=UPI002FD61B97